MLSIVLFFLLFIFAESSCILENELETQKKEPEYDEQVVESRGVWSSVLLLVSISLARIGSVCKKISCFINNGTNQSYMR